MTPEETLEKGDHDYNFLHALSGFTHDKKVLRDQLVAVLLAARVWKALSHYFTLPI